MISRIRRILTASLAIIIFASSGAIAGAALPALAAPSVKPSINRYVSLGDSFAAGQGAGDYLNTCLQSARGYPALLDAVKGTNLLRNASCSGATTMDVQSTQLAALNQGTTMVTVTVGGNDLDSAGIVAACLPAPASPACQGALGAAQALLNSTEMTKRLAATYGGIAAAAPAARTVFTGYPYLFETPEVTDPMYPAILAVNSGTAGLNATIQGFVGQAQSTGANVQYVDVAGLFAGHGIGSVAPWINDPWSHGYPDALHPNAAGYRAYAQAIQTALK